MRYRFPPNQQCPRPASEAFLNRTSLYSQYVHVESVMRSSVWRFLRQFCVLVGHSVRGRESPVLSRWRPAQLLVRGPTANRSEATATTEMTNPPCGEMDRLTPRPVCGSHSYWLDGEVWQCWNCVPPPSADMVRVDLNESVNSPNPWVDIVSCGSTLRKLTAVSCSSSSSVT